MRTSNAVLEGGHLGLLGMKKGGMATTVEKTAMAINYRKREIKDQGKGRYGGALLTVWGISSLE
jgi:hypothetical protein